MTSSDPSPGSVPAPRPPAATPAPAAPSVSARAQIECIAGPEKGKKYRVAPGTTVIGRDLSCDVALTETPVSRQHARIDRTADGWVLKNLSANGTRLNKKPIEEAPLTDGDVIGVGAKTRLRFDVETVAISSTGRPQFRARVAGADEKEEAPEAGAEAAPQSLFQRRKKLFIVLGAYAALLIVVAVVLVVKGGDMIKKASPPAELALVDIIQFPDGKTMRIISETPELIVAEDDSGQPHQFSMAQFQALKAQKILGIQNALLVSHIEPAAQLNKAQADLYIAQAEEFYTKREQEPANLYKCVRHFQLAQAALRGAQYLPDARANQLRITAERELVDKVHAQYSKAGLEEKMGHDERAVALYNSILNMLPDPENPICKNISLRKGVILDRNPKLKIGANVSRDLK